MTLEEKRAMWEKGLGADVVAVKEEDYQTGRKELCLVILKHKGIGNYYCHRYFLVGDDWEVSVDASNVNAETAMKWAFDPKVVKTQK